MRSSYEPHGTTVLFLDIRANYLVDSSLLHGRQRPAARNFLEQVGGFWISWNFFDRLGLLFRKKRRQLYARQFLETCRKLRISERSTHGVRQYIDQLLRGSGRQ